jgi:two-component system, OmpR family, sensor kinase
MSLPIRVRLTAWYVWLLAAIVVGLGAFLVLQLEADLGGRIDEEVQSNAVQIARGYVAEGPEDFLDVSRTVLPHQSAVAQVIGRGGRPVVAYGDLVGEDPLVSAHVRARALGRRTRRLTALVLGADREHYRGVVLPVRRRGRREVLVVAESRKPVEDSVQRVLVLLLIAGPAALALTGLGGWWLARKALLPVARMTSQAQKIGIDALNERIAIPRVADELGHLAVTLNAMLDRLERGVDDKRRLIADASHELRTPLSVMRAELDVSLRVDDLPREGRIVLESVREEVDGMTRIVDNLLTLAQVDEGRLALLKTTVGLHDAVETAARPLRPMAAAKGVRLETDGEPCAAQADAQRLHQALTVFIENAIKFGRPGGQVRVTSWNHRDEVGVTVTDDGPGIPAEAHAHVFDRFYRVDPARERDGGSSGLGLAICREIVVSHGGRVWLESEEGKGSAFSLALPGTPGVTPAPSAPHVLKKGGRPEAPESVPDVDMVSN